MSPSSEAVREVQVADVQRLVHSQDCDGLVDALVAMYREEGTGTQSTDHESQSSLTAVEAAALTAGGMDLESDIERQEDPEILGIRKLAEILIQSLADVEVAKLLDLSIDRVRDLAKKHELFTIGAEYGLTRFPAFQFSDDGLLPGFRKVAGNIPRDKSICGVEAFFCRRNPDLYVDDDIDQQLSPVEWLESGRDPAAIIKQLRFL